MVLFIIQKTITRLLLRWNKMETYENMFVLDGKNMKTYPSLYDEISEKLNFPDYFGRNLDALNDCMSDLSWIKGESMVICIQNGDMVLESENNSRDFWEIINRVKDGWNHYYQKKYGDTRIRFEIISESNVIEA